MNFKNFISGLKPARTLEEYLQELSKKPLYIYGAGSFGHELFNVLTRHNIAVKAFIDQRALELKGAPIEVIEPAALSDSEKKLSTAIIGIVMNKPNRLTLEADLRKQSFSHIVDGQSIRAHYVYALSKEGETNPSRYYARHLDAIEKVYNLLEDEESRQTYEKCLKAHLLRDYTSYPQTDAPEQYFEPDVRFLHGFRRFIDCGAYIGDTLELLASYRNKVKNSSHYARFAKYDYNVEEIVALEPDEANFARLNDLYDAKLRDVFPRGTLIPAGASNATGIFAFSPAGGSGTLSVAGESLVQTVELDKVLKDFNPTFIKMDIEGAEYNALLGAKEIIQKARPDLAICVYHIIDDFFRLPLLIHEYNPSYRFYLRAHSSCCMETVLYCTIGF